ncbi:DmsC/YnfH family molybdoenzyme membrane anchor subunit [Desulfosporosinus sp. PR]|uniref:dimethyl sulfoxide reductase anchor subunit family protein n=1 Tax=Candidatus Desulfosporosinus nitrosoreducens TaxID=3401928 RepID=UPI0027F9E589|nr:DmsC/YnfH family molybdoenzyme membrane anchor subunit [Desulfosporosinus sp. PR]MDQ7093729.1 DmsC/YnfH family molybdoenzyme membrane anchor subunit [Desulfosporosinus sp. PR]
MASTEWPLIIFTILTQMAVGTYIVLAILRALLAKKIEPQTAAKLTNIGLLAVGPVMAVALLISLFHLGSPLIAFYSIANLGTSWLSREILFSGLFFFLWIISYYFIMKNKSGNALNWITAIVGLLAVFSMSNIYSSSIMPAWMAADTFVSFFGTTIVLGLLASAATVGFAAKGEKLQEVTVSLLQRVSLLTLAVIVLQLIFLPEYLSGLAGGGQAGQTSAQLLSASYSFPMLLHWLLTVIGAALLTYVLYKKGSEKLMTLPAGTIYLAFIIVLAGEFVGRFLFYASAVPIRIG